MLYVMMVPSKYRYFVYLLIETCINQKLILKGSMKTLVASNSKSLLMFAIKPMFYKSLTLIYLSVLTILISVMKLEMFLLLTLE